MEATTQFDIKPLLRPHQVEEAEAEVKTAEAKLSNPAILDKGEARKQLIRLRGTLESQRPRPPATVDEEGKMVAREKALLDDILQGMPSQEEMRKAPPGAVDKHMGWEKRNKAKILEWKNLRLRLNPGAREAANLERHRPVNSSLSMDNAVIPGRQIYIPDDVGATVIFSDADIARIMALKPGLAGSLAGMTNAQRQVVKEMLELIPASQQPRIAKKQKPAKTKRLPMSAEQRQAFAERMAKSRADRAAKLAQGTTE